MLQMYHLPLHHKSKLLNIHIKIIYKFKLLCIRHYYELGLIVQSNGTWCHIESIQVVANRRLETLTAV